MATDPSWPGGGTFRDRAELDRFLAGFREAFGEIELILEGEPEEFGNRALFRGRWRGRGAASGIETESVQFWVVTTIAGGRLEGLHFSFSEAVARERATG